MTTELRSFNCCSCEYQLNEYHLHKPCPECGYTNTSELQLAKTPDVLARGALRATLGFPCLVIMVAVVEHFPYKVTSYYFWRTEVLLALFLVSVGIASTWAIGVYVLASSIQHPVLIQEPRNGALRRYWDRVHRFGKPLVTRIARHGQFGWIAYFAIWYAGTLLPSLTLNSHSPRWIFIGAHMMQVWIQLYSLLICGCLFLCFVPVMFSISKLCQPLREVSLSWRFKNGVPIALVCVLLFTLSSNLWNTYNSTISEWDAAIFFSWWVFNGCAVVSFLCVCSLWWQLYFSLRKISPRNDHISRNDPMKGAENAAA